MIKLGRDTAKLAKRGEEEVVRASKIGKLKLEVMGLERNKGLLYQKIGEKTIDLCNKGKIEEATLKPLCNQIYKLDSQIKKKQAEIKKIKK